MRLFRTTHCRNCLLTASLAALGAAALAGPPAAIASPGPVIKEFTEGITGDAGPVGIAAGPDGNVWFTEVNSDAVASITPAGAITEFPGATRIAPYGITTGSDGNLWFLANGGNGIGRITPDGTATDFSSGIAPGQYPLGITAGPDGNLWFTEPGHDEIGRMTTGGVVTDFSAGISRGFYPYEITSGPDGNLWFTESNGNSIGRITTGGVVTEFPLNSSLGPRSITVGPDGNLWFAEIGGAIGRITTSGEITEFTAGITPDSSPTGIAAGADGNLWFTEYDGHAIGRITPAGEITEFTAGLSSGADPVSIAAGPDGNLWFTERLGNAIGRITVSPATSDPPAPPAAAAAADKTAPSLTRLTITPAPFWARKSGDTLVSTKSKGGALIAYRLSEAANTTFTIQVRHPSGWYTLKGSPRDFEHAGTSGANNIRFTGRIDGRRLKEGGYRLVAKTTDPSGNKSTVARKDFRIRG